MKNRILLTIILGLFTITISNAQKIKLKNEIVYIDGKECMKYKFINGKTEINLYELNSDDEFMHMSSLSGLTKIYFVSLNETMETRRNGVWKWRVKDLINHGVINTECVFNEEKAKQYFKKFNEKKEYQ